MMWRHQQVQKCGLLRLVLLGIMSLPIVVEAWSNNCGPQQKPQNKVTVVLSRRETVAALVGALVLPTNALSANAAIADETNRFADNDWPSTSDATTSILSSTTSQSRAIPTDEFVINIPLEDLKAKGGLGLELGEVEFRTNIRVFVESVLPGSLAESLGIQKDWIVVAVNKDSAERTNAQGVTMMVSRAIKGGASLELRFRDPAIFRNTLENNQLSAKGGSVTTQVAPAGDTTQRNADGSVKVGRSVTSQTDQRLSVSQLVQPKMCTRGAQLDDLLEISYLGTVVDTGAVFDGSSVTIDGQGIPGRGNDVSIFFVLGKQPFGQFPPGWDVGLDGICVGERRRIVVPPALAYGSKGLPRRGIPPNATLQYDVTLVSLNGLATPQ